MKNYDCGIDSLSFELPLTDVEIHHPDLLREFVTINIDDGDIVEEKRIPVFFVADGIKLRFKIVYRFGVGFLNCTLSTKLFPLVGLDYTKDWLDYFNFLRCLDFLKRSGYFTVLNLNSIVFFDVDFAVDGYLKQHDLEALTKIASTQNNGSIFFVKTDNPLEPKKLCGVQFNKRNAASIRNPFYKVYNKSLELDTRSRDFKEKYNISVPNNLLRLEVTLKNKRHLERFGLPNNIGLLQSSSRLLFSVIMQIYNFELPKFDNSKAKVVDTTPTVQSLSNIAFEMINSGYTLNQFINFANVTETHSATASSRLRSTFREAFKLALSRVNTENIRYSSKDVFLK